jgi:UDP-N-acetylglucosamine 1-carboxyvinyltransferase
MENSYIIKGGKPLRGEVTLSGAKNVAVKVLIAALLFEGEVILKNIPRIRDVFELIELLKHLGATVSFLDKNTISINGNTIKSNKPDEWHASKIRTSFMLFAPLLHRFKEAYIPNPGGCNIGARALDRIVEGMEALGIQVTFDDTTGYYHAQMKNLPKGNYTFKKPSHTGTELMIILSALSGDTIFIDNAGMEPEIDDLINFLNQSGANITRNNTSIKITGVKELRQTKPYTISMDRIEAVTYAVLAIATKGDIIISKIEESAIKTFNDKLIDAGGGVEHLADGRWRYFYKGALKAVDITTDPHPGFMTDWQPPWAFLMTQAKGDSMIVERIYENRFAYIDEFKKLGAEIKYVDYPVSNPAEFYFFNYDENKSYNQAINIKGSQELHSAILEVADLRAGATLAIAALAVEGESIIKGVAMMERGYEDFEEKITALGGDITKV